MMAAMSVLLVSLLLGVRHALEADHLAAVASLATRSRGVRDTVVQGVSWGLGHTITLLAVGGACLLLRATIPPRVEAVLEGVVGLMLLFLGAEVLWRLYRRRVHVHVHRHSDGVVHLHAHAHAPAQGSPLPAQETALAHRHQETAHEHPHGHGLPHRALFVGLVHGLAGSAALLLVTLSTLSSPWLGLAYILVFGAGSILGMAALSAVIALPLTGTARRLTGWYNAVEAVVGISTLLIGAWVLYETRWLHELGAYLGS